MSLIDIEVAIDHMAGILADVFSFDDPDNYEYCTTWNENPIFDSRV